jgi:hypothetical protein
VPSTSEQLRRAYVQKLPPRASATRAAAVAAAATGVALLAASTADQLDTITQQAQQEALDHNKRLADAALIAWAVISIATTLTCGLFGDATTRTLWSLGIAFTVIAVALVILTVVNTRPEGGIFKIITGPDGRLSTSYTQGGVWTLLLAFAFTFFIAKTVLGGLTIDTFRATASGLSPAYLLLLGGPFAVAAAAGVNYAIRTADGSIQKTESYGAQLRDVISDDAGRANLNDTQFFVFNLVTAAAFVVLLAKNPNQLPQLPSALVALTSVAALAFITTKTVSNQRPVISSVTSAEPSGVTIVEGSLIEIHGSNFVVPGAEEIEDRSRIRIRFESTEVGVEPLKRTDGRPNPTASSIYVKVPALPTGVTQTAITVITAAGVESNTYPFTL